jgi:hypothetical protein
MATWGMSGSLADSRGSRRDHCGRCQGEESLTDFSRTERTVRDYSVQSGHPVGRWPAILDCFALAGHAPFFYGLEGWGFESLRARHRSRRSRALFSAMSEALDDCLGGLLAIESGHADMAPRAAVNLGPARSLPTWDMSCLKLGRSCDARACPLCSQWSGKPWATTVTRSQGLPRITWADAGRSSHSRSRHAAITRYVLDVLSRTKPLACTRIVMVILRWHPRGAWRYWQAVDGAMLALLVLAPAVGHRPGVRLGI